MYVFVCKYVFVYVYIHTHYTCIHVFCVCVCVCVCVCLFVCLCVWCECAHSLCASHGAFDMRASGSVFLCSSSWQQRHFDDPKTLSCGGHILPYACCTWLNHVEHTHESFFESKSQSFAPWCIVKVTVTIHILVVSIPLRKEGPQGWREEVRRRLWPILPCWCGSLVCVCLRKEIVTSVVCWGRKEATSRSFTLTGKERMRELQKLQKDVQLLLSLWHSKLRISIEQATVSSFCRAKMKMKLARGRRGMSRGHGSHMGFPRGLVCCTYRVCLSSYDFVLFVLQLKSHSKCAYSAFPVKIASGVNIWSPPPQATQEHFVATYRAKVEQVRAPESSGMLLVWRIVHKILVSSPRSKLHLYAKHIFLHVSVQGGQLM